MRYAMAVDTKKCVGCSDCVVACQTENNVPIGYCRDWVVEVMDGTYPQLEIELRGQRGATSARIPVCEMLSHRCQSYC
jgi:Fe-S-cluster-containing dehydrogenase component